jgi:hypothetical protein
MSRTYNDIWVFDFLQEFDFSQRSDRNALLKMTLKTSI